MLTSWFDHYKSRISNFDCLRLICEQCHGPAEISTGECLKCKHISNISLDLPAGITG